MIGASDSMADLVALGRGESDQLDKTLFERRALATVRYADAAAWTTATAIARAMASMKEHVLSVKDRVAVVVTSEHGPAETLAAVANDSREGFPSPLRYPAANPGSLAGVPCIAFGFRGPTLNLLAPPALGVPLGLFMAGQWLNRAITAYALIAVCRYASPGCHLSRAVLLGLKGEHADPAPFDRDDTVAWMMDLPSAVQGMQRSDRFSS